MATQKVFSNTWRGVMEAARDAGAKYPELVAAQWALESGWGKSVSGKNNYFGIKGSGTNRLTQEVVDGKTVAITAGFIDFASLGDCVNYLVTRWYKDYKSYKGVNNAASAEAAARELVKQNYATDPQYAEKLIQLMKDQASQAPSGGPVVSGPKGTPKEDVVFRMTATQPTWLKKRPVQSTELGDKEKVAVEKGRGYAVLAYEEVAGEGHAKVTLAANSGTWFVFEPHWARAQASGEALPASVDWNDFNCLVTPHLTVGEILQWDKRRTPGPDGAARGRLVITAKAFQEVRDAWGSALGVTSFYRPEPINQQVGGVPGSRHTTGEAFDIYPVDRSLEDFYQWIRRRWTGGLGDGRNRGFVHLDRRNGGHFVPGGGVYPSTEWLY